MAEIIHKTVAKRTLRRVFDHIPRVYDRTTLAMTGVLLNAVSGYQIIRGLYGNGLPNLGDRHGNVLRQAVYDSGQHFGPSLLGGMMVARAFYAIDRASGDKSTALPGGLHPQESPMGALRYAATACLGAAGLNVVNECCEQQLGRNVLGVPAKGIFSYEDIISGASTPLVALGMAALIHRLRASGSTVVREVGVDSAGSVEGL